MGLDKTDNGWQYCTGWHAGLQHLSYHTYRPVITITIIHITIITIHIIHITFLHITITTLLHITI